MIIMMVIIVIVLLVSALVIANKISAKTAHAASARKTTQRELLIPLTTDIATAAVEKDTPLTTEEVATPAIIPPELETFVLIQFSADEAVQREKVQALTKGLPRPHPILLSLMQQLESSDDLYEIVKNDPEIVAKILQTVNSSSFYLTQKITRLHHAILYLGTRMVRDIALRIALQGESHFSDHLQHKAVERLWSTAYVASSLGYNFAKQLELEAASEYSLLLLLISIGDLALLAQHAEFAQLYTDGTPFLERIDKIQRALGTNPAIIGEMLAEEWELPKLFQAGIRDSLVPFAIPPQTVAYDQNHLQMIVFCYLIWHLSEYIVLHEIKDIAEVPLPELWADSEFYYLRDYAELADLTALFTLWQDPIFQKKMNHIVTKVNFKMEPVV